jgi:hypothetical protein
MELEQDMSTVAVVPSAQHSILPVPVNKGSVVNEQATGKYIHSVGTEAFASQYLRDEEQ